MAVYRSNIQSKYTHKMYTSYNNLLFNVFLVFVAIFHPVPYRTSGASLDVCLGRLAADVITSARLLLALELILFQQGDVLFDKIPHYFRVKWIAELLGHLLKFQFKMLRIAIIPVEEKVCILQVLYGHYHICKRVTCEGTFMAECL